MFKPVKQSCTDFRDFTLPIRYKYIKSLPHLSHVQPAFLHREEILVKAFLSNQMCKCANVWCIKKFIAAVHLDCTTLQVIIWMDLLDEPSICFFLWIIRISSLDIFSVFWGHFPPSKTTTFSVLQILNSVGFPPSQCTWCMMAFRFENIKILLTNLA